MEKRQFGKTDMKVSALGFGGAEIGFEKASVDTVARVLGDALDAGLNVIDTAECYLQSEELIGQAMASRRSEFFLFTKCGHPEGPYDEDWRPDSLLQSIRRSLQRLEDRPRRPGPASQLLGGRAAQGRRHRRAPARPRARLYALHRLLAATTRPPAMPSAAAPSTRSRLRSTSPTSRPSI